MITVIGDLAVDIIVHKDKINYATDTDGSINFRPGGQGNNVAAFISKEGVPCRLIGKVGNDPFGIFLIDESKKRGLTLDVQVSKKEKTGSIIVMIDNKSGERSMISDRGANALLSKEDVEDIKYSRLLYLSGYSFFTDKSRESAIYAKKQALQTNIPVALDPSSTYFIGDKKDSFLDFIDGITFLFPNYDEGILLTGEKEPKRIVEKLREYVKFPILTLGEKGCLLFHNNRFYEFTPEAVEAIDTTGAGDSFAGAFLATYYKEEDIISSVKRAIKVSSETVTHYGSWPD